jgi:hypothetical protein
MASNEQHFKRDAWLSGRHRVWGSNVPAMDMDFILAEYDKCVPVALIDYKHEHGTINLESANNRTLTALGDMASIPAFIVRYGHSNQDGWWGEVPEDSVPWFQIIALNSHAHTADLPSNANDTKLSELVFVSWLYEMRGRKIPQAIVDRITKHDN